MPAPDPAAFMAASAPPTIAALKDRDLIAEAERRGLVVTKDRPTEPIVRLAPQATGRVRFAVVSDTHLGSKWQQLTHLHDFYAKAREWGAAFMLNAGDVVDGTNMHKDQQYELHRHGATEQAVYAAERYPVLTGKKGDRLPTYLIQGNHDWSFQKDSGTDVLKILAAERGDLQYLGAMGAVFETGPLRLYLHHPAGGVAYARSYKPQKLIEQFAPEMKPHILLLGHWHITVHLPAYRNVEGLSIGCFQAQTPFLRRLGLAPVIGGVLIEAEYGKRGLEDFTTRWVTYRVPYKPGKDWP